MCLLGLEIGVNTVCTFKRDRKTQFVDYFFLLDDKNKMQLNLSCCTHEVAGDVSQPILVTSLKFGGVTNL